MRWIPALLAVCLLGGPVAAEDADRRARIDAAKRKAAESKADFDRRVNEAIDRGVAWLRSTQRKDGTFPGFSDDLKPRQYNIMEVGLNALVVLTLAHCGVGPKDEAIKKCLAWCRFHYAGGKGSLNLKATGRLTIYTAATLMLALDALYKPEKKKDKGKLPHDRYGNPVPPKIKPCKYPSKVRKWLQQLVNFIVNNQLSPSGGWRYPGNPLEAPEGDTDLSNVQYALLALDAVARCGIKVPADTWTRAAQYLLKTQEEEGLEAPVWIENEAWEPGDDKTPRFTEAIKTEARGWAYRPGLTDLPNGSMTCAGTTLLGLVKERLWFAKKLDPKLRRRIDRGILDGLAWLSENFSVEENPTPGGASQWHYYYLYGLERTGAKLGVRFIGKHDWYREGGEHLLAAQLEHGGWAEAGGVDKPADKTESAITQSCFALLFLRRTTPKPFVPMMPPLTGGGDAPKDGR